MSMAGVPPSSADFTPSWLKFNSNKKCGNVTVKDNSYKRAVVHSRNVSQCHTVAELESSISSRKFDTRHSADKGNPWPHLAGIKALPQGISHWPSTSKVLPNQTFSTTSKNFSSVVNGFSTSKRPTSDTDFPTLGQNHLKAEQLNQGMKQQNNVWNKPLVLKSTDNVRNNSNNKTATKTSPSCDASSIYKALVPKSSSASIKQPYKRTVSVPSNTIRCSVKSSTKTSITDKNLTNLTNRGSKEKETSNATLSSYLPTTDDHPSAPPAVKRHLKGKNVFLKELRLTDESSKETLLSKTLAKECEKRLSSSETEENLDEEFATQEMIIGNRISHEEDEHDMDLCDALPTQTDEARKDWWEEVEEEEETPQDNSASQSKPPLSSSLEEEHRLLRQMGWTEGEEGADGDAAGSDESPLTDAEIREFFLNYKKKGLLSVSSPSHRETAFRDAFSTWLLSGPPVMRRNVQSSDKVKKSHHHLAPCSTASSSDFSNLSSSGVDSD